MSISELCIRRPVFTWVLVSVPVVLGLVSYLQLGVDLFPKVDFPFVSVQAELAGASAEEMESSVTKIIEESLNTISGVDELRSITREGSCQVIVQFDLEKNGDIGAQEVRDKMSLLLKRLPIGMEMPVVSKFDLDAAPIMTITISGRRDIREITEIAKHKIQEPLQTVSGVGAVFLSGGRNRAINVWLDVNKLASYKLSVDDVRNALMTQNVEIPGGVLQQGPRELVLRTIGRVPTVKQFNSIVVASRGERSIRIEDIARVEDSFEEPRSTSRLDNQTAVSLFVQKQSGTNTIKVSDEVQQKLSAIRPLLPPDMQVEITQDQSRFVRNSMEEVRFHLLLAAVLVSLTIMLFIRDWRTTVIATLAIPTSIVPTFLFMWYMGFTLNNITMLGLILAIGIVIDDAVVVHENIFRHMEEYGKDAMTASRDGTKEISLAVLATSLSLLVIFLPIGFMGGIVGRFFSSFGLTVAFAITMSLFVSFTLTPMLCSRFLKLEHSNGATQPKSKSGLIYRAFDYGYGVTLRWSLHHRWLLVLICILVILSTGPIAMRIGMNLVPRDDQSEFQITFITPEGYTLKRTDAIISEIETRISQLPGIRHHYTVVGQNSGKGVGDVTRGSIYFRMAEIHERGFSQFDSMSEARKILMDYPDIRTAVTDVSAIQANGQDTRLFQMTLQGPDLEKLAEYSDQLRDGLQKLRGLSDVDSTLSIRKPELQVSVDRDRAADLGVSVQTIASTLNVLVAGQPVTHFKEGSEQYDVWLRADEAFRSNPQTIDSLMIPTPKAGLVPLTSLAGWDERRGPSQIDRLNRQRTVTIMGNPDGVSLNEAVAAAGKIAKTLDMPPEYQISFAGQAKTLGETGYYFMIAFVLSLLFMYLILAAQFESWIQPISILTALPVTIPFGLLSMMLFRQPLDLYALFGLFMLVGIVKKNGILQVDKTNELVRAGQDREEAILEANHTRLRPILMTTVMLIAAMVPIAIGQGPGSGARASMAKIIIGGQALSLLLALLVTPVTYSLFDDLRNWSKRVWRRIFGTEGTANELATHGGIAIEDQSAA